MQVEIDPTSDVPLYQQLRDRVVEAIAEGRLEPGVSLASVRQVAVAFGINVATVSKGYDMLRHEGLIRTNRKSGSVVARGPHSGAPAPAFFDGWRPRARTLFSEALAQGVSPEEVVRQVGEILTDIAPAVGSLGDRGPEPRLLADRGPEPHPPAGLGSEPSASDDHPRKDRP